MTDTPQTASERVVAETGILSWLGVTIELEEEGQGVLRLPHQEELTNPNGDTIHGGVIAMVIDNAAGTALRTVLSSPETAVYATTDLNVSYLRPATSDLRVDARVRRNGRSLAVIQADAESKRSSGEWTTVAVGRATYYVDESGG